MAIWQLANSRTPYSHQSTAKGISLQQDAAAPRRLRYHFSLLFEFFCVEMGDKSVNDGLKLSVHYFAELVQGQADAMVGHAVLREVIGTDFFAAIPASHHGFAFP